MRTIRPIRFKLGESSERIHTIYEHNEENIMIQWIQKDGTPKWTKKNKEITIRNIRGKIWMEVDEDGNRK